MARRLRSARGLGKRRSLDEHGLSGRPKDIFLSVEQKEMIRRSAEYTRISKSANVLVGGVYIGPSIASPKAGISVFFPFENDVYAGERAMVYAGVERASEKDCDSGGDYAMELSKDIILDATGFHLRGRGASYAHIMNDQFRSEDGYTHEFGLSPDGKAVYLDYKWDFCKGEGIEGAVAYGWVYWFATRARNYLSDLEVVNFDNSLPDSERSKIPVGHEELRLYRGRVESARQKLTRAARLLARTDLASNDGESPPTSPRRVASSRRASAVERQKLLATRVTRDAGLPYFIATAGDLPDMPDSDFGPGQDEEIPVAPLTRTEILAKAREVKKRKRTAGAAAAKALRDRLPAGVAY